MDYRKRPPPGHRKPGTERTYPRTPGIQPQAQIIPQEWQKQIHPHFSGLLICGNCGQPMTSSISTVKKTTGTRYSLYFCPTHRKSKLWCTGKSTLDPIVGEFVFNYILNMLNAQKAFSPETSIQELEQQLLSGDTFSPVVAIAPDGLQDLFHTCSAPAPSRERSSEKTSKSKPTLSLRCNYQSSKRKRSVWKELLTV